MLPPTRAVESSWAKEGCPLCGGHSFHSFFSLKNFPVSVGILCEIPTEANLYPTGDINLTFCNHCSFIGNSSQRPKVAHFDQSYDNSLHHSQVYKQFIHALVDRLINSYKIKNKTIIDIGCGQTEFLQEICERGQNRGIGIDPSAPSKLDRKWAGEIKLIYDFYSERYFDLPADLVVCRHVVEIVPNPRGFLDNIRQGVGGAADTVTYLETPNAEYTFTKGVMWNIEYPNTGYFYPETLARLAQQTGFEVLRVAPCFDDDQYLGIDLKPGAQGGGQISPLPKVEVHRHEVERFFEVFQTKFAFWEEKLRQLQARGEKVVAWCAGGRAIFFFCLFGIREEIPYVVDLENPRYL